MNSALVASAFAMGFLGSTHCVAMCGGVVAMTCSSLPIERRRNIGSQIGFALAYNAGRIGSYAAFGALAGGLGASAVAMAGIVPAALLLRTAAGMMMVAVGLYLAGISSALGFIERAVSPIWRLVAPGARRLLPIRHPLSAFALGLIWGWMPCGLVYAALASAITSGSGPAGAATMAAFGVGTLPMLLALGSAGAAVARLARARVVRCAAGAIVLLFGAVQLGHVRDAWASAATGARGACCPNASQTANVSEKPRP
jgi:hypothetical protein